MIWEFALPRPRLIEIFTSDTTQCRAGRCKDVQICEKAEPYGTFRDREAWKSHSALLYVCRESATIARKVTYETCLDSHPTLYNFVGNVEDRPTGNPKFSEQWQRMYPGGIAKKGVRFRPDQDTIYYRKSNNGITRLDYHGREFGYQGNISTTKIQPFAIDEAKFHYSRNYSWWDSFWGRSDEQVFPDLKFVIIVLNEHFIEPERQRAMESIFRKSLSRSDSRTNAEVKLHRDQIKFKFMVRENIWRGEAVEKWDLPPFHPTNNEFEGYHRALDVHTGMEVKTVERLPKLSQILPEIQYQIDCKWRWESYWSLISGRSNLFPTVITS